MTFNIKYIDEIILNTCDTNNCKLIMLHYLNRYPEKDCGYNIDDYFKLQETVQKRIDKFNKGYMEWIAAKKKTILAHHDVYVKDDDGNVRVERIYASRINSTPDDYSEYIKHMKEVK